MENDKLTKVKGTQITLENGKEYSVYITKHISTSTPIVKMYEDYNPIYIFAGDKVNPPKGNFIALDIDQDKIDFGDSMDTEFPKLVIQDKRVINLFKALTRHQKEVWVGLWKNHPHFQPLFDNPQIKPLGLPAKLTFRLSNKVFQYKLLKDIVSIPKFIVTNKNNALNYYDDIKTEYGVFTSLGYGGQGAGTRIHSNKDSLEKYLSEINDEEFLMINALKLQATLSIDILIANEKEILVYGMRSLVHDGLKCMGSMYPSDVSQEIRQKCYTLASKVGKRIARVDKNVRGYFNIDINLDNKGNIYYGEINARYGGCSGICALMMDQVRPLRSPKLVDMGVTAMKEGTFNGFKLWDEPEGYYWCQREIRAEYDSVINPLQIPNDPSDLFAKGKGIILMGQLKPGVQVKKGDLLGITVSLQNTRKALEESMIQTDKIMEAYVKSTL